MSELLLLKYYRNHQEKLDPQEFWYASCHGENKAIQTKIVPQPGAYTSLPLLYNLWAEASIERSRATIVSCDYGCYLLCSKMHCLHSSFYTFTGSSTWTEEFHWRIPVFLRVTVVVTTEHEISTHAGDEAGLMKKKNLLANLF